MLQNTPHPRIATESEWRAQRVQLLEEEKELTRHKDRVNARLRRLPMTLVAKNYLFDSTDGRRTFIELFDSHPQLIVYHFMFDPGWDHGCMGCTGLVNGLGDLSMPEKRQTKLILVSRAPLPKLLAQKQKYGWTLPWYSSFESSFNYDYHVTLDETVAPLEYNYRTRDELLVRNETEPWFLGGEAHGLSVFFKLNDQVYHTYSTYGRGCEGLCDAYSFLDRTPYGRQEDFEDSPVGWPQRKTYG